MDHFDQDVTSPAIKSTSNTAPASSQDLLDLLGLDFGGSPMSPPTSNIVPPMTNLVNNNLTNLLTTAGPPMSTSVLSGVTSPLAPVAPTPASTFLIDGLMGSSSPFTPQPSTFPILWFVNDVKTVLFSCRATSYNSLREEWTSSGFLLWPSGG